MFSKLTFGLLPKLINRFFSNISKRTGISHNVLYITNGVGIFASSALFYYFYSNLSSINTSWFKLIGNWGNSNDAMVNKTKIVPYENKYYDKFEELESVDLEEDAVKSLKNNVLYEMTPKGRVIIYYDFEKEAFIYYCDTKDVPYLYLETVARKYALTYHCKKIVFDIKKELELAKETNDGSGNGIGNGSGNKNIVDVKEDKLFATFKNYNRKGSGGSKVMNKKFVLRQNANRYSYNGKVNEFPIIKRNEYKVEKPMDKMDYETFKKLMAKKN